MFISDITRSAVSSSLLARFTRLSAVEIKSCDVKASICSSLFFSFILDYPPTTTELARVNSVSIFIFSIYQALIAKYHKYLLLYEKKILSSVSSQKF